MIAAGKLDRQMELLSPTTAPNPLGQGLTTYTTFTTVYGERLELRTSDAARSGQRDSFAMAKFRIRYRADLTTEMRIRSDGKLYDIRAIDEPDRRKSMILTVEEVTR